MARKLLVQDDAQVPVQQYLEGALDTIVNADQTVSATATSDALVIITDGVQVTIGSDGTATFTSGDTSITLAPDGIVIRSDDTTEMYPGNLFDSAGNVSLAAGIMTVGVNGVVDIGPGIVGVTGLGVITLGPAVTIDSDVSTTIGTGSVLLPFLATADPAVADQVWVGAGIVRTGNMVIPELPAVPTPEDIADALLALGLVTQAA